jgi:hypothetical protein
MTITVSLEELKKYQEDSRGWGYRRGDFISNWVRQNAHQFDGFSGRGIEVTRLEKDIAVWDEKNPQPTLVPPV